MASLARLLWSLLGLGTFQAFGALLRAGLLALLAFGACGLGLFAATAASTTTFLEATAVDGDQQDEQANHARSNAAVHIIIVIIVFMAFVTTVVVLAWMVLLGRPMRMTVWRWFV